MLWPKSLSSYPKPVCGLFVTITRDGSGAGGQWNKRHRGPIVVDHTLGYGA